MFVHARNATVRTAMGLIEMAKNHGETSFFQPDQGPDYGQCEKQVSYQVIHASLQSLNKSYCIFIPAVFRAMESNSGLMENRALSTFVTLCL